MKTGIIIAGIIDLVILLVVAFLNILVVSNFGGIWFIIVVIADILLIIGTKSDNSGLIIFWLIIAMINIVLLFISWLVFPIIFIIGHVAVSLSQETCKQYQQYNTNAANECDTGNLDGVLVVIWILFAIIIILPIYYIYLWIVVKSHRANLVRGVNLVLPIHGQQGEQAFVVTNPVIVQQQ